VNQIVRIGAGFAAAAVLIAFATACGGRQSDWEAARKADTPEAYTQFLQRYPDGDFTAQARDRLAGLKEESDWKAAATADNVQGYQQFLAQHPEGAHADEARIRVENFHLAQAPIQSPAAAAASTTQAAQPAKTGTEASAKAPGPVAPSPTRPVLPAAVAPSGKYRVQLGAFSTASRAHSEWLRAVKGHPAQLSGLGYTVDKAAVGKNTLYRLQTSGVPEARARSICAALKATGQACVVVVP